MMKAPDVSMLFRTQHLSSRLEHETSETFQERSTGKKRATAPERHVNGDDDLWEGITYGRKSLIDVIPLTQVLSKELL